MMQMIDKTKLSKDDLLDVLFDLKHDLGKYVKLPFSMLAPTASDDEFVEALETALQRTRSGPQGIKTARQIWNECLEEAGNDLALFKGFKPLEQGVARLLSLEDICKESKGLDRVGVERSVHGIGPLIMSLIEEVNGGT